MPSDNDSEKKDSKENYFATLRADYEQTHQQINQLADIRFKLLAFVPTVSTLATLLGTKVAPGSALVGGFLGFFAILGITMYELRNSQIYDSFIDRAKKLEELLSPTRGEQYSGLWNQRPDPVVRLFGIPARHKPALAIIYSTALGGWLYLILYSILSLGSSPTSPPPPSSFVIAASVAGIVTIAFFLDFLYIQKQNSDTAKRRRKKEDVHMRAIVYHTYGSPDVLKLEEVEKPSPTDDEVLVKVYAASVNALDWHLLTSDIFLVRLNMGFFKPKHQILGADVAGRVEAVGRRVQHLRPGDEVFGDIFESGLGGCAEYVSAKEDAFVLKPENMTFDQVAAVPVAALTALQGLRDKGQIQPGQKVLINGASGGVGTFAVQIAKALGAEVTAVCSSRNVDMVRGLGADQVIDYTKEDFTKKEKRYDLILAANGYHPIFDYKRALSPKGRYVMSGGSMAQFGQAVLLGPVISMTGSQKMGNFMAKANHKDLLFIKELLEDGKIVPVIDKRFSLNEVADALRYFGEGHAKGKVVITVDQDNIH